MKSQHESLKKALEEMEPEFGPDNQFVKGLKARIAMYEKPPAENPTSGQR